jgi:hypothetical protein
MGFPLEKTASIFLNSINQSAFVMGKKILSEA